MKGLLYILNLIIVYILMVFKFKLIALVCVFSVKYLFKKTVTSSKNKVEVTVFWLTCP